MPVKTHPARSASCSAWFAARRLGLAAACMAALVDQVTKHLAVSHLLLGPKIVIPGFFNLHLAVNRGVSFSFLAGVQGPWVPWALSAFSVAVAAALVFWLGSSQSRLFQLGVGLLAGGALGNAIDRMALGVVVDFLDFVFGRWHFATFNMADVAINLGVGLLCLDMLIEYLQKNRANTHA